MSKKNCLAVNKPWGYFEQFTLNEKSTVKILLVKSGESLSLQNHKKREELWIALDDGLIVQIGNVKKKFKKGSSVFVKKGQKHRLLAKKTARVLEISFGSFDEKDIVRYEDKYKRC